MLIKVYQIHVSLVDSKPPIWRRLQVLSNTFLPDLHNILQIAMGWSNSHLHQFVARGAYYTPLSYADMGMGDDVGYEVVKISDVLRNEKDNMAYVYDFGDDWTHKIVLEKILPVEQGIRYPVCIKGKSACPPEDCGGVYGYMNLLEVLKDPKHEDYEDMMEWVGEKLDPKAFSLEMVNNRLWKAIPVRGPIR